MKAADETTIEAALVAAGKTAPRLTAADIDSAIVSADYHVFPGTTLTVCALKLRNGFVATGTSAAASQANFDEEIGKRIAYANARERVWELEGYLFRQRLSEEGLA